MPRELLLQPEVDEDGPRGKFGIDGGLAPDLHRQAGVLAWICHLHEAKTPEADWFEVAVIHHTDCGSALFADDDLRHTFAARGGHDEQTAADMAVLDPVVTVRADVALLRAAPELRPSSEHFAIGGYAYDLETGLLTTVVPPA
ncbi:hypothetical protein OG203_10570 [Nocardia sp. NBC_01499]|uniref:hypothetical protein n=1 Tax=Nocardia sp. NBC_01499 TaxID=2903597 RepID=UPI0038677188